MHETADDLTELQALLDRSYERAGEHLRSVFTPDRRIPAAALAGLLPGVQVLNLATVTRNCEPRVAPVDGLFYRGRFWFGSSPTSTRFTHLRARPQVSATHTRGESLAIVVHGRAALIDLDDPANAGFRAYCLEVYGPDWEEWGAPAAYARIDAERMYTFGFGGGQDAG
jgi:pyridoxamine 5'-phosphate oxidase-like protein